MPNIEKPTNLIEFICKHCGAKNSGRYILHTDEDLKRSIKKHNDFIEICLEKNPRTLLSFIPSDECKYVICQLCQVPNYIPLKGGKDA